MIGCSSRCVNAKCKSREEALLREAGKGYWRWCGRWAEESRVLLGSPKESGSRQVFVGVVKKESGNEIIKIEGFLGTLKAGQGFWKDGKQAGAQTQAHFRKLVPAIYWKPDWRTGDG